MPGYSGLRFARKKAVKAQIVVRAVYYRRRAMTKEEFWIDIRGILTEIVLLIFLLLLFEYWTDWSIKLF